MFRFGSRFKTVDDNSIYIIAQVSKKGARVNKIALINLETGELFGRVIVVKNFNKIYIDEIKKAMCGAHGNFTYSTGIKLNIK